MKATVIDLQDYVGLPQREMATFGCAPMSRPYGHIHSLKMAKLANFCGHLICELETFLEGTP